MTSQARNPETRLLKIQKTVPAEQTLLLSNAHASKGEFVTSIVAGAVGEVVDRVTEGTGLEAGDEVVACLTQEQLEEVSSGANVRIASYAVCRKPSNISASQCADLVTQFLASAVLLDQAKVFSAQHLDSRPGDSALNPNNVALMMEESKTNVVLIQLLCHLFPGVDVFCHHKSEASPEDYAQALYFMLPLESGARASAHYPPNSKHDLAGYFRANAEHYTKSSNIGLAVDTAGMIDIKPEVREMIQGHLKCYREPESHERDPSKLLVTGEILKRFPSLVESEVIRPVALNNDIESY
ncbi:hypothetical protein CLAFUW4_00889 [Fulvia fulva]|nr:hypothetical protein CLAFUR4_00890 [Fulvia fulva]WPV09944.1 hypothetical protein CLAFUW4_00889 [Fulvia fulva]WPV23557.1 hypothetical protein CLAFUW7_00927 [Fulvia fulva]